MRKNSVWDKLVFSALQRNMGGRLRLMITGSAPLAGNVLNFMRCALGCLVSKIGLNASGARDTIFNCYGR